MTVLRLWPGLRLAAHGADRFPPRPLERDVDRTGIDDDLVVDDVWNGRARLGSAERERAFVEVVRADGRERRHRAFLEPHGARERRPLDGAHAWFERDVQAGGAGRPADVVQAFAVLHVA